MAIASVPGAANGREQILELVASRRTGYGLPRAFYHDPALYQQELDRIWRQGWVFTAHCCELPRPGDYVTLELDADPVIVVRGDDGAIRAFHNVCTHRGTLLCEGSSGHARAIVCPYHQWTFSLRGDLLSCRGMHEGIDRDALGLRTLHVETLEGLIFVSFAERPPDFEPARRLMAPLARPQGLERARVAAMRDYTVAANWKLVWENNRECYHCNVNHPEYIRSNFDIYEEGHSSPIIQQRLEAALARSKAAWREHPAGLREEGGLARFPEAEHDLWYSANRTVLAEGYESESLDGARVAPLMGEYRDGRSGVLRLRSLPNFWLHASCDHAVTTRLLPAGLHGTRIRVSWLVDAAAREGVDYELERLLPFWQLTSEQDWALCERGQRGVHSSAYRPGPLSRTREYNLDDFLTWYTRQLE